MRSGVIIGITGGIGSGKSMVSEYLQKLGYPVYDSDSRAKYLITNDLGLRSKVIDLLGDEAYSEGDYNRKYVSGRVFEDRSLLIELNKIVHPVVKGDFSSFCAESSVPFLFKESALLFDTKESFDFSIYVSSPLQLRLKRVLKRDAQRTKEEVENIISNQIPESKGCLLADFVIVNDETESVVEQVEEILEILKLS